MAHPTENKTRRRLRGSLYIVLPFLCLALVTGCWDRKEINDLAFVMATAIDKDKDGFRVSVLIPLPGNMGGPSGGGGGSGGQKPFAIDSETGSTPNEAIKKLQNRLSRQLYFAHRRVLLYSEDVLKDGIVEIMDGSTRTPDNRLTTMIAATKGKASDYLSATTNIERFATEAIREMLQSDISIPIRIKDVIGQMNTPGDDARIPYLELVSSKDKNPSNEIQITGFAITSNGKMVGVIKNDEALGFRWLRSKFKPYWDIYHTEKGRYSVHIDKGSRKITPSLSGSDIRYDLQFHITGYVTEAIDSPNYENADETKLLEKAIASKVESEITRAIKQLQQKKSDSAGFGQLLYRTYPGRWNREWKANWENIFPTCTFHVSAETSIHKIGMLRENLAKRE
ncbi:Ger(x)C family spore germination protein [Paenibacillus sp. MBLB4367]|uniref:Ger(x)C family spore germination protein n=1 Tax=Paenibacillus sp. MBLB4367 TaxID=3384767 RepID=UPI003908350D